MREVAEQGGLALSRQHEIDQTRHMRARLVGREQCAAVRHTSLAATVRGTTSRGRASGAATTL